VYLHLYNPKGDEKPISILRYLTISEQELCTRFKMGNTIILGYLILANERLCSAVVYPTTSKSVPPSLNACLPS
jgi:hypothetical protein